MEKIKFFPISQPCIPVDREKKREKTQEISTFFLRSSANHSSKSFEPKTKVDLRDESYVYVQKNQEFHRSLKIEIFENQGSKLDLGFLDFLLRILRFKK